ncbi:DUF6624 domain-containing protein [Streptomyces ardesiacus]|uniref:DUF6624 domain-containing protein n=1 Tax=Streptomyces ardesiacus TaxID=285564 RepID=UPI00367E3AFB
MTSPRTAAAAVTTRSPESTPPPGRLDLPFIETGKKLTGAARAKFAKKVVAAYRTPGRTVTIWEICEVTNRSYGAIHSCLGMSPHALAALAQTQHDNAAGLKRIVERLGQWPGRSTVGADACQAAVDIAVHSDHNPALQRTLLGLLRRAVEAVDATSAQLAHLQDRCLVNVGQAQLYGTQHWYRPDGLLEPHPIADRAQLDSRRAGRGPAALQRTGPPSA